MAKYSISRTARKNQYKLLPLLSMIFVTIGICCPTLLERKLIESPFGIISATSILGIFLFIVQDMIAEIYGYTLAKRIFFIENVCELVFVFLCIAFVKNSSIDIDQDVAYAFLFNNSLVIEVLGTLASIIAWYANIYLLIRWKVLAKGKYFWLRSVGSSSIGIIIFTLLLIPCWIFSGDVVSFSDALRLGAWACFLKISCMAFFSIPITFIVRIIKIIEHAEPMHKGFNPFTNSQSNTV